ncbi:hypothetical protein I3843_07G222000 [Carya illinoinensis]|nr:uncharacterized protein LOC122316431 [Carya illinoinensis]KAG2700253.1 hypothetical protein I3760_07G222700 [Carya illinoinensis]KAG6706590.1 hypothetical protein I3842_07G228600 [Carya illinoinensis]KAG7973328.1 hypothetical protein I3843_07G222000 [Carya illinoinensis]
MATQIQDGHSASISENLELEENDFVEDYDEEIGTSSSSCGCFRRLCFGWCPDNNVTRTHLVLQQHGERRENWVANKPRQVRQFSEVLGGPKWKNFIRFFSLRAGINKKMGNQYRYDLQSYTLNFDDGINKEEDCAYPDVMARYTAPLG